MPTLGLIAVVPLLVLAACSGGPTPSTDDAAPSAANGGGTFEATSEPPSDGGNGTASLPDKLTFVADATAAAETTVTLADGGSVAATASDGSTFELVVPPMAVAEDTEIRMTPLSDVGGVTTEEGIVHAVQLEPEGQVFFAVARLTITPATPIAVADQLMFEASGDGSDPGPALIDPSSEAIVILLDHFSEAGVAKVTPQQRALFLRKSAENSERRIEREIRAATQAETLRELLGTSDDGGLEALAEEHERLVDEYDGEVVDKLREAALSSCEDLNIYIRTMISAERQRVLLLGSSEADTVAMNTRIAEALSAMTSRYDECEKEAIASCTAEKDPAILVEFWLAMERPADPDRAELICDPQGHQFEFSGSGTGNDGTGPVHVTWHVWGLLCEGDEQWRVWEEFETEGSGSSDTGPPGDSRSVPILITFGEDGAMTDSTWVFNGFDYLAPHGPRTVGGITFTLSPPERPTQLDAVVPIRGEPSARVTVPVVPADGTIAPCEPAASP